MKDLAKLYLRLDAGNEVREITIRFTYTIAATVNFFLTNILIRFCLISILFDQDNKTYQTVI
jgi:hypothetical protein